MSPSTLISGSNCWARVLTSRESGDGAGKERIDVEMNGKGEEWILEKIGIGWIEDGRELCISLYPSIDILIIIKFVGKSELFLF